MFKNYFKVALRNLNRNRIFALINVFGLALGLTVTILVFLFVTDELSYDKHWDGYDRIHRAGLKVNMMGQKMDGPASPSPMATSLRTEFTEIESATRFQHGRSDVLLRHEQNKMYISNAVYADSAFFKVFNFEFIHGNSTTALKDQNAIVLTEETAKKLFGDKNALGEIVNFENRTDYIVRAIVKDPIENAHFQFNVFISQNDVQNIWLSNNHMTYLKLNEGIDSQEFFEKMSANFMEKIKPNVEQFLQIPMEEFYEQGNNFEYTLQPLEEIHLHSHTTFEIRQNGNIMYVYVFIGIAVLVILIAGINFMNLSTARSGKRAKEVGVRKVAGASKKMLVSQFLFESVIQSIIALFIALALVELFLPGFNNIMETNLSLLNSHWMTTLGFALIITLGYGLFAGSYP
ncbi:MAG: ABC transporter permease, partial [Desulfobulbia bacterium]